MKIKVTEIPDVNTENIDLAKVNLSNRIIEKVKPLFDDVLLSKLKKINLRKKTMVHQKRTIPKKNLPNLLKRLNQPLRNLFPNGIQVSGVRLKSLKRLKVSRTSSLKTRNYLLWIFSIWPEN